MVSDKTDIERRLERMNKGKTTKVAPMAETQEQLNRRITVLGNTKIIQTSEELYILIREKTTIRLPAELKEQLQQVADRKESII